MFNACSRRSINFSSTHEQTNQAMQKPTTLMYATHVLVLLIAVHMDYASADNSRCQQAKLSVQVLGSGGPEFYKNRASTSYLLRYQGKARILIDAGSGSKFRFGQSGADFNTVKLMLFSHFHVDHSSDFPAYIKSAFFSDRNQDLLVYGPIGNRLVASASDFVAAMIGEQHSAYPYLSRYLDGSDDYRIIVKDIKTDKINIQTFDAFDGGKISAIPVHHGAVPALAWRVDLGGKSIVFSGDMNGDNQSLPRLAKQADLLIAHNAIEESAVGVARNLHMPPSVIGKIAHQAQVKQLVLSHRMHRTLGKEQETLAIIKKYYKKPVQFANDLDCFVP